MSFPVAQHPRWAESRRRRRPEVLLLVCRGASALAAAAFVGLVGLLLAESLPLWRTAGLQGFLLGDTWFYRASEFGALSMIYGSSVVAGLAVLLAAPLGLGAAFFTAERLAGRPRMAVKLVVELLAGVPSVVYGLLGLLVLRPWVYDLFEAFDLLSGDTLLTGGLLLAVMILPTVTTFADDALSGVPAIERQAARALGLTRAEVALRVVAPQALPGLVAAVLLGLGRAAGETIAVFLVVGRQDNQLPQGLLDLRPILEPGQTLTTKLGGSETFIAYGDPLHWAALAALGLVLLAGVAAVTLGGSSLALRRFVFHPGPGEDHASPRP